jgi:hypothetical protein
MITDLTGESSLDRHPIPEIFIGSCHSNGFGTLHAFDSPLVANSPPILAFATQRVMPKVVIPSVEKLVHDTKVITK